MHILQLCPRVPYPPHDGGAIAMYDVAAGLARAGHRVTVLALNTPKHHQLTTVLDHLGPNVSLVTVDVDTRLSPVKALRNLLFSHLPYNVERFVSEEVKAKLVELLAQEQFDVVQMEGTFVAWYARYWAGGAQRGQHVPPVILRAHNLEYTIWEQLARNAGNPLKKWYLRQLAARLKQFENWMLCRFDAIAAITETDQQRLSALGAHPAIEFIPAGVDLSRFQPDPAIRPKPRTLFMLGSLNWLPNLEGLDWFLREVWPEARRRYPELELHLAGKDTPERIRQLQVPGVTVHGFVESAAQFMQTYDLMLVPLLSGGGMRIKIIEGMALGKCILSTRLGAEGIHVRSGHDIVLADSPAEWLDCLGRYYRGELGPAAIGQEAARTAARLYDNRRVVERFLDLYSSVQGRAATEGRTPAEPLTSGLRP
ncbi:glycosyltransferase family 4 protein [Hymenobacter weizhouensis]|uniref:glycosyltransferase family 4 protein n=1 Tax=Hymenobacter sp. YIM 151500-1 TaxID=2987689 RepID=UPI002225BCF3|nr:glycosyltransferase family 4 protein [Hymenobacter sp. YIM 151500-1]UYZ64261.1 glycosyltransferase family 4 protein [Hymenobacter sp. YIM 151500-1]